MEKEQLLLEDSIYGMYFNRYLSKLTDEQKNTVSEEFFRDFVKSLSPLIYKYSSWRIPSMDRETIKAIYLLRVYNDLCRNKVNHFLPKWNYYKPVFRTLNYEIYRYYTRLANKNGEDALDMSNSYPIDVVADHKNEFFYNDLPKIVSFIALLNESGDTSMNKIARLSILKSEYVKNR